MKGILKENIKNKETEPQKQTTISEQNKTEKKAGRKTAIIKRVKQGTGLVTRSGDFIGRLGTLLVMIVTTINTGTITVTSFIEGVYWKGGVHAFLLVFIHLPVIGVMIWLMCKAKVQAIYRKVRPSKPGEPITITDVDGEAVVYEETVVVQETEIDKNKQEKTVSKKVSGKMKKKELETKAVRRANAAGQINKAFDLKT